MRYLLLVGLLCVAIALDLALFVSASHDTFEPFDPLRPATLLPIVAGRLHSLEAQVRSLDARDIFNMLVAPYREPAQHESPTQPPSR